MKTQSRLLSCKAKSFLLFKWNSVKLRMREPSTSRCSRLGGLLHVRSLAIVIAVVEILFLITQAVVAASYLSSPSPSSHILAASLQALAVVSASVAVTLLLIGLSWRIPALLVPHILMQVLFVLTLLAMACISLYTLFQGTSLQIRLTLAGSAVDLAAPITSTASPFKVSAVSGFLTGMIVIVTVGYVVTAVINVWCFHVVMDCYRWLGAMVEEKSPFMVHHDIAPIGAGDAKPVVPVIHATDF